MLADKDSIVKAIADLGKVKSPADLRNILGPLGIVKDINHERLENELYNAMQDLLNRLREINRQEEMEEMLESQQELAESIPTERSLQEISISKGINVKEVNGQLRGSFLANMKEFSPEASIKDSVPSGSIFRKIQAADMLTDRGFERFELKALKEMASKYPGKPILLDHDWSARSIVGKVMGGNTEDGKLILEGYFPKTKGNEWVVENIEADIFSMVSVGFAASPDGMMCSLCGCSIYDKMCPHYPGETTKNGEQVELIYTSVPDVYEVSIVAVPMQPEAHIKTKGVGEPILKTSTDTIDIGIDTIRNSSDMDNPLIEVVSPEVSSETSETAAPQAEQVSAPSEPETPVTVEPDIYSKAVNEFKLSQSELHAEVKELHAKASDVQAMVKTLVVPAATPEVTPVAAPDLSAEVKSLQERAEKAEKLLVEISKKLDLAMTATTEGLKAFILEEVNAPEPQSVKDVKKKLWVHDYFGQKETDLGGLK